MEFDYRHRVGVGLLLNAENDGTVAIEPARDLVIFDAVVNSRHFLELDRRAILVAHHHLTVVDGLVHLAGGLKCYVLLRPVERSDGGRRVGARNRDPDVLERQPPRRGRFRVRLDANRELLRAVDTDLRHPRNLRQGLTDGDVAIFVDGRQRQRRRAEHDKQDREVRRIHLAETRRSRHLDRQPALRDGQRSLDVERRGVDLAIEIELDRDDAGTLRRVRRHRRDSGDGRELPLDDAGDRCRHGIRAGARQGRGHRDGRKINPRQRRNRQQPETEHAESDDRRRDQRRHHWPANTQFRQRHRSRPGLARSRFDPRAVG